jgi:hypothetical protein
MRGRASAVVLGAAIAVLPLAGCGAGSTRSTSATPSAPATTATAPPQTTPPAASIPSTNGASSAILPVRLVVDADDLVSPPIVGGPANTTIELTVASHASHPVTVAVASHSITVPPGGHAKARLPGLKRGHYSISVNGTPRAALVAGAQPGP